VQEHPEVIVGAILLDEVRERQTFKRTEQEITSRR
jgi:hypothetical protein